MLKQSRRLSVAAFAALALGAATSLAAQDNSTVGPPQLKDFRLPGQRTTPPATTQPVQPGPQAPTTQPSTTRPQPGTAAGAARPTATQPQPARAAPSEPAARPR